MTAAELRTALIAAFPPSPITRETIYARDASWTRYEERDALELLVGSSWVDLSPELLERHYGLLIHAGHALYREILPAYLLVLAESELATMLPFVVVGAVTRLDDSVARELFPARVGPMTTAQRDVVRRALEVLARQPFLREPALLALGRW